MARAARAAAATLLSLGVLLAASGWLYLVRPLLRLPGPVVRDALPLDELPHHAAVPLLLFVAVWGVAAVLLGALARWAGADRLTAGLLLGPAVGAWLYALNGVSILVVRQIPAHQAFHAAAHEQAVVFPAVLASFAGALLAGRGPARGSLRARLVLAWLVGGVGLLAAVDAVFPEHRSALVAALDPAHVHGISKALVAPLAAALVVTARGLARGNRRAWQVATVLLFALLALHVERRFDEGAIVTGVVLVAAIARRADFSARGDPAAKSRVLVHALLAPVVVLGYGLATLWVNRLMADEPYTIGFALRTTAHAVAGMSFNGSHHLSGPLAEWFPLSAFLLAAGAALLVLAEWLAPWRHRVRQEALDRVRVRRLVAAYGDDTLAPFALRADKSYFFSAAGDSFLAYRVVGGIAVVAGDPIGPKTGRAALVGGFLEFAHERGWRVAVLGASEGSLELYRSLGLRALYHGDEAVVETASFSLEGRAIRKVRQSVSRLEAAGYRVRALSPSEIDAPMRDELEAIARAWRGANPERGFVMALDALFGLDDEEALFVVGFDVAGAPKGFLHFAISPAGSALSLSTMPRLACVPNGFNEWLICESIAWARAHGYARVSLNFAPFSALLAPDGELTGAQRLQAATLRGLKGRFQLDNLLHFNRKFFPVLQRRFVVYERRLDLPRVGVAALAAESYLPFQ
ncbi:MAG: bifunctional lysylphosphatidylglycerol flippase/synthetase MprF [Gaiellaceae bacterium]